MPDGRREIAFANFFVAPSLTLRNEDYNEDDAYDALDKIDELVKKNEISWECRRNIVDSMMEQFYAGNSGFDDMLIDSCEALCQSEEEKLYLADKISESSSDYYRRYAAGIYLKYGKDAIEGTSVGFSLSRQLSIKL